MSCAACPRSDGRCKGVAVPRWCELAKRGGKYRRYLIENPSDSPARPRPDRIAHCPFAEPLRSKGKVVKRCKDRWCSIHQAIVCRLSDCKACPVAAGRMLEGPRA